MTDGPGGASETWVIDVKNGNGSIERGGKSKCVSPHPAISNKQLCQGWGGIV